MSAYLLPIGVAQDVASHYVDEVGLWVEFSHEATEPPPEPKQRQRLRSPELVSFCPPPEAGTVLHERTITRVTQRKVGKHHLFNDALAGRHASLRGAGVLINDKDKVM